MPELDFHVVQRVVQVQFFKQGEGGKALILLAAILRTFQFGRSGRCFCPSQASHSQAPSIQGASPVH